MTHSVLIVLCANAFIDSIDAISAPQVVCPGGDASCRISDDQITDVGSAVQSELAECEVTLMQTHMSVQQDTEVAPKANISFHRYPTEDEKAEFVSLHNMFRCRHGAPPITWSDAVAADAESWAAPLTSMIHSDSYSVSPPAGPAGENIYWNSVAATASDAVQAWYNEVNFCIPAPETFQDGCYKGTDVTGHFTCMIWTGVKEIGCAFSDDGHIALCRYKAGDSVDNETPNVNGQSGNYVSHVLPRSVSEADCATMIGNGEYTPNPTPAPTEPSASCVSADGCFVTTSGCGEQWVEFLLPCKHFTLHVTFPNNFGPYELTICEDDCGVPTLAE